MKEHRQAITVLMADDDQDDCLLVRDAFSESRLSADLRFVDNGETLLDYLQRRGVFADPSRSPRPGIILLDLNMPKKDGREALKEIKSDPDLRDIPVVILTTSKYDADISSSYSAGANSFVTKPATFDGLLQLVKSVTDYWFDTVQLPQRRKEPR